MKNVVVTCQLWPVVSICWLSLTVVASAEEQEPLLHRKSVLLSFWFRCRLRTLSCSRWPLPLYNKFSGKRNKQIRIWVTRYLAVSGSIDEYLLFCRSIWGKKVVVILVSLSQMLEVTGLEHILPFH